jgi:hypothetical protein
MAEKRIPWGPHEPHSGPTIQNVRVGNLMGVLHKNSQEDAGYVVIPPAHYQPPPDTLRFLPEYKIEPTTEQ